MGGFSPHGRRPSFFPVILLLCLSVTALHAQETTALRRYALIAGVNNGGYDRVPLRYAVSDARAFAKVMQQMGGVAPEDQILLTDPDYETFQSAVSEITERILAADPDESPTRRELIVYYSGHADEEGLLFGRERYPYSRLRREVSEIQADVRIAVLDSCSSGSFTRTKGGTRRPAFLVDSSRDMKGYAFLTSSAADEVAQESDRIGGSFFTHYLVTGLRGAADANADELVTLNEAYQYAFSQTLASTERTAYGPQHPAYDINLTGTGDLVLTDLRRTNGKLLLEEDLTGRLFLRDEFGSLMAELDKRPGSSVQLAVEPGTYRAGLQRDEQSYEALVQVPRFGSARLGASLFVPVARIATTARGSAPAGTPGQDGAATSVTPATSIGPGATAPAAPGTGPAPRKPEEAFEEEPFKFSIAPELHSGGLLVGETSHKIHLGLLVAQAAEIRGLQAAFLAGIATDHLRGFQGSLIGNAVGQDMSGVQGSGLLNYVGRDVAYVQAAGVANYTRGMLAGYQTAGLLNVTMGALRGFQHSGGVNIAGEDLGGAQLGLFNYTQGTTRGAQTAALANHSFEIAGAQLAALGNHAGAVRGAQVSGILNIATDVRGAQVATVNVAEHVVGTQIGLINISDRIDGVPIGLINYERQGSQHFEMWWDGAQTLNFGLRLGAGYLYTLLRGGYKTDTDPQEYNFGGGWGFHVPLRPFFLNVDGSVIQYVQADDQPTEWEGESLIPEVRLAAGFAPQGGFGILVGTRLQLEVPGWHVDESRPLRMKPNYFVGIQAGHPRR